MYPYYTKLIAIGKNLLKTVLVIKTQIWMNGQMSRQILKRYFFATFLFLHYFATFKCKINMSIFVKCEKFDGTGCHVLVLTMDQENDNLTWFAAGLGKKFAKQKPDLLKDFLQFCKGTNTSVDKTLYIICNDIYHVHF